MIMMGLWHVQSPSTMACSVAMLALPRIMIVISRLQRWMPCRTGAMDHDLDKRYYMSMLCGSQSRSTICVSKSIGGSQSCYGVLGLVATWQVSSWPCFTIVIHHPLELVGLYMSQVSKNGTNLHTLIVQPPKWT